MTHDEDRRMMHDESGRMTMSRRHMLRASVGAGAALWVKDAPFGVRQQRLITRAIPSTGETLPVIGLGSADTFNVGESESERAPLRQVLRLFHEMGGRVFDTAPTYGTSEMVAGALARELGIHRELFLATKVSTLLSFVSAALDEWGREEGLRQQQASREAWDRNVIDLNQVHNLEGAGYHLETLRRAKDEGSTRYVGVTVQALAQYADLETVMEREELDFIQINYSMGEREAADRILPLAQDRGLAVIVNKPYNAGLLFGEVRGRALPEWAAEFDCTSWGQFFLKYILGHPAVTVAIPATSNPEHLLDNMGAGVGRLPDAATRRRMEEALGLS